MNKDTASRQGSAVERFLGGSGGEALGHLSSPALGGSLSSPALGGTEANKLFFNEAAVLSICQSILGQAV